MDSKKKMDHLQLLQSHEKCFYFTDNIDIEKLENLAQLSLDDSERNSLQKDLFTILLFINQLEEVDITDINDDAYEFPIANVFRKDEISPSLDRSQLLCHVETQKDGYITIPKIIDTVEGEL